MPQAVSGVAVAWVVSDVLVDVAPNESDREFVNEDDSLEIKH